jgi:hypothetical protein
MLAVFFRRIDQLVEVAFSSRAIQHFETPIEFFEGRGRSKIARSQIGFGSLRRHISEEERRAYSSTHREE